MGMNSLKSPRDETREIMSITGRTSMMFYEYCDPAKTIKKIPVLSRQHAKDPFLATIILLFGVLVLATLETASSLDANRRLTLI